MAKRKSNRSPSVSARRVIPFNTNRRLPRRVLLPSPVLLNEISDYRSFHPHGKTRSFRDRLGRRIIPRTVVRSVPFRGPNFSRGFPLFADLKSTRQLPRDAVVCVRRRIRKEVLFASRRAGRGGQRRPSFNPNSDVICRR